MVFRADLPDDELDVLSRDRNELARHLDENFGLVLEVRAEGVLAYDPSGALTDLDFPGGGSAKQAALLLLDELTTALQPSPESVVMVDGTPRRARSRPGHRSTRHWPGSRRGLFRYGRGVRGVHRNDPCGRGRSPDRDERWRLSRAGIVNVWHYLDNEFDLSGGRMILRGTNGSGCPPPGSRCPATR